MIQQFPLSFGAAAAATLKKQNSHNETAKEIGLQIGSANLKRTEEKVGGSHDCANQ